MTVKHALYKQTQDNCSSSIRAQTSLHPQIPQLSCSVVLQLGELCNDYILG